MPDEYKKPKLEAWAFYILDPSKKDNQMKIYCPILVSLQRLKKR